MFNRVVGIVAVATAMVATAGVAQAQQKAATAEKSPIELGADAAVFFNLNKPRSTSVDLPVQSVRAGFFVRPNISLEPSFGLSSESGSGSHVTNYNGALSLLYHFTTPSATANTFFVRPFVGMVGVSSTGSSNTAATLGGALGVKVPLTHRIAARFEGGYRHMFKSGDVPARDGIGISAGLSFFTR